jgi:hypothetical protein
MNDKEISEIRRHFKAERSGISRIRGCYVNEKREIISELDQSLGLMSESEVEEILSLLKKTLSGRVGTNLLDIAFSTSQVAESEAYRLLARLRETELKDDQAVHDFFNQVIQNLDIEGNYMILMAHDRYDVFTYRKDGHRSEEAGEMFTYILCTICPVKIAKPALSYYVRENCFRHVTADSVVAPPALGFLFPAFDDRCTNLYGALYYTRSVEDNHTAFTDAIFNAGPMPMPAAEQKATFRTVLADAAGEACSLPVVRSVRAQLCQAIEDHKAAKETEPLTVDKYAIRDMLGFCGVPEENMTHFEEAFDDGFGKGAVVSPHNLVDTRRFEVKTPDACITVSPEKTDLVETRIIDGVPYILIRAEGGAQVNGVDVRF